jgi:CheY-like chemotaxis protein
MKNLFMAEMNKGPFGKVMVIDDDPIEHFISERVLQVNHFGREIVKFLNAKDALLYLQKAVDENSEMPVVIFLDINMEGMDGYAFMREFQQFPAAIRANISVVILSSTLIPDEISVFYQYPEVKTFLEKPLTKEKLHSLGPWVPLFLFRRR